MISQNNNGLFYVAFTFKNREDYTTKVRYFCETGFEDEEAFLGQPDRFIGTLRNLQGLGYDAESIIPSRRTGTIVLDNTRGSAGVYNRFADYLVEEEIIEQTVTVYSVRRSLEIETLIPEVEFQGVVDSFDVSNDRNMINIKVGTRIIEAEVTQTQLTDENFPGMPDRGVGAYLPVVFGDAQVPTYRFDPDGTASPRYAYATSIVNTYPTGGVETYYAKNSKGKYVEIEGAASTTTALYGRTFGTVKTNTALHSPVVGERAESFIATNGAILTRGTLYLMYSNNAVFPRETNPLGSVEVRIFDTDSAGAPRDVIGRATFSLADQTGYGNHIFSYVFDKPVVVAKGEKYFIAPKINLRPGTDNDGDPYYADETYTVCFTQDTTQSSGRPIGNYYRPFSFVDSGTSLQPFDDTWIEDTATIEELNYQLFGVTLTDTSSSTSGFGFFQLTQATPTGLTAPDLGVLDFIVDITGLRDDSIGTLTGVANNALNGSLEATRFILRDAVSQIDYTSLSPLNYQIGGATRGRRNNRQILEEVLKQTAAKLVPSRNGKLRFYSYGTTQSTIKTITEDDCKLISWESKDSRYVINNVELVYDERAIPLELQDIQTGLPRNYAKSLRWEYAGSASNQSTINTWTEDSFNLYKTKRLSDSFTVLNWIKQAVDAERMAEYYLTVFSIVPWMFNIELPYFERDYQELDAWDIVTISHIDLPNTEGTSPQGLAIQHAWRKARSYEMRIVKREVNYNVGGGDAPTLSLKLKVLNNPQEIY